MESMFSGCTNLESIDLSKFTTNKIKSFYCVFLDCKNLKTINLGKMDTSSVTTLSRLFYHCEKLEYIDISSFNTSLVTIMNSVFFHCYSMKIIAFPDTLIYFEFPKFDNYLLLYLMIYPKFENLARYLPYTSK